MSKKTIEIISSVVCGDGMIGLEDIRPLYDCHGLDDEEGKYPHRLCDLQHIFIHLITEVVWCSGITASLLVRGLGFESPPCQILAV